MADKPLSILFISSEAYPFAKTGGLADVSYSLPLSLREFGHDIRIMLPKYGSISERKNRIHEINRLKDIPIHVGNKVELATVKSSSVFNSRQKVQSYITTNFTYFDSKKGLYKDPRTGAFYADNDERFIFFNKSVLQTCMLLGWFPDIIHCNDWRTGLIPAYIRTMYPQEFRNTKVLFTIHNFSQQGIFPLASLAKTGLSGEAIKAATHEGSMNFTKAALSYADVISTVSPTYASELLKDKELSFGLHSLLKKKAPKLKGIRNGIDQLIWNPKTDPLIKENYDRSTWDNKSGNKEALLRKFGLKYNSETPVIGMISHINESKGIPLVLEAANELFKENVQLVFLGDGEIKIKRELEAMAKKSGKKCSVIFGFDDDMAHLIEAGADFFLMPSQYEPCGLNQMYSLTYGTIPIVRQVGGLAEPIVDYNPSKGIGNGFIFKDYTKSALMIAIKRALTVYKDKAAFKSLALEAMTADNSWGPVSKQYDEFYRSILK